MDYCLPFSHFLTSVPFISFSEQHKLEGALLALGQFQHALEELMSWLTHTEELLDAQRPISGDPKVIEVELAKHHVSILRPGTATQSVLVVCTP